MVSLVLRVRLSLECTISQNLSLKRLAKHSTNVLISIVVDWCVLHETFFDQ